MSYRNYICSVDKKSLGKIRNLSYDKIIKQYGDNGYISEYTFENKGIEIKRILEIGGQAVYKENMLLIKECLSFVFSDDKVNKALNNDSEFMLGDKKLLKNIIEIYRKLVIDFYEKDINIIREMYRDSNINYLNYFITRCENKVSEFSTNQFVSDNDNILHCTPQYEYDIFNLIYILKTFDWDKNYLLWVGS